MLSSLSLRLGLLTIFAVPLLVRWLSWLNILQKKEYRLDRLWAFIKTQEGIKHVFKILPTRQDLTRHGLRRPKPTLRVLLISTISFSFGLAAIIWGWRLAPFWFFGLLFLLLLAVPDLALLASAFVSIAVKAVTQSLLWLAQAKLQRHQPIIIGITGSYGKTSTKHLLTHLLNQAQPNSAFTTQRSFNTPLSVAMQTLRHYQGEEYLVLEYAAYKPGEIRKLAQTFMPHLAIITGFTPQHLAIFGSEENIIKAKAELIEALPLDGITFFNQEVEGVQEIVRHAQKERDAPVKTVSFTDAETGIAYEQIELTQDGFLSFLLDGKKVQTKFVGRQYLSIIQGAVAAASWLGLSNQQLIKALSSFQPDNMFVKLFQHPQGFWILDDGGTANPAGFHAAITLFEELTQRRATSGKKVLITAGLIDLGEQTSTIHQQLATASHKLFDQVLYLGEPGKQQFSDLFQENCLDTIKQSQRIISNLSSQDFVLVEGKLPPEIASILKIEQ